MAAEPEVAVLGIGRKISELIRERRPEDGPFIAFEFFPPRTESGVQNLRARFARLQQQGMLQARCRTRCSVCGTVLVPVGSYCKRSVALCCVFFLRGRTIEKSLLFQMIILSSPSEAQFCPPRLHFYFSLGY